jgi:CRISPR system Cascade subunit CasE
MVELELDMAAIHRFLQSQNLIRNNDEDLGYGLHAWISATFGSQAIKPFRLFAGDKRRAPRLLGYTSLVRSELLKHAQEFASPMALSVCDLESELKTKLMPGRWEDGRHLGFRVMTCPVSRKEGIEKDVFLRALDRAPGIDDLNREQVYSEWLARQLKSAALLVSSQVETFQLGSLHRKGASKKPSKLIRPRVEFTGVLKVADSDAFSQILVRGVGRHRSFGYGMLLLSPAK